MASSIPTIDIINENAVYDLYMRRLNRVWMRRLEARRAKERTHSNGRPRSSESRKLDARPISVPPFVREGPKLDEACRHRRRRRPSREAAAASSLGEGPTATRSRPKSAPDVVNRPTASWAELRDRTHAATGPGPTSFRRRHHHGDDRASPTCAARPDSAPNPCRHSEREGGVAPREHSKWKQHASVWLAPRITRLERETNDLLTACNNAGRKKRDAARWTHGFSRPDRADAGAGIEDLGRGAVVRLIGNLGMGRYAHRFRAFAVTGSDLASCTERDLIQIGVDFRPHRLRLLREIKISKELGLMAAQRRHNKTTVDNSDELTPTVTSNQEDALQTLKKPRPSAPALVVSGSPAPSLSEDSSRHQQGQPDATGRTPDAQARADIDEPSSDATTCTPYNNVAKHTHGLGSTGRVSTSTQASASPRFHLYPEGERAGHEMSKWVDRGEGGDRVCLSERGVGRSRPEATEGFVTQLRQLPGADTALNPLTTLPPAALERCSAPRLKGTLQVSSVRAGDVSIALGGSDPFMRVRTCDQLQRADLRTKKGVKASWRDAVLSFSVTDQALSAEGIHIELCDGGGGGEQEAVASGSIPGDVTFQLICCSRSNLEEGNRCAERKHVVGAAENIHSGGCGDAVQVEVRLYAKIGGEDAGVCTLNLIFKPDVEKHGLLPPGLGRRPELTTETLPQLERETPAGLAALTSPDVAEIRQSSLVLVEETARHIEAIKDVRRQHRQAVDQPDQGGGKPTGSTESEEGPEAAIAGQGEEMIAGQFLNRQRSIEEQMDAAVILQSHARRIAASNVVKRRVKVRTAANRVQAFARQRMGAYKIRHARENELVLMRRRDGAALRLQNNARRRLAVKTTKKARAVHAERNEAAAHIQEFAKYRIRANQRKHYAATKVQGIARVRGAKAEARRLQSKKLAATRREEEEDAASRIQQFSRQNIAYKRGLAHIEEQRRAAVMLQTRDEEVVDTAARSTAKNASAIDLRRPTTYMAEDRRQAAAKIQKIARARATAAKRAADAADIKRRNEAARRLQAYARQRQPPKTLEPASGESWIEADGGVNERAERECHAPDILHSSAIKHAMMKEMQSSRQAEAAAAVAEQRVAVRRIQRGWRHRAAHRDDDRYAKVASPSVYRAEYALRVTPALKVPGNDQEAAMCIQAAFRGWLLARETTLVGAQGETERWVDETAPRMQCPSSVTEDEPQLLGVRREEELAVQEVAQRDAAVMIKQRKAAVCIQRALRMCLAVDRVARLRRELEDGIQRSLQLEAQTIAREAVAACIQRAVRAHHATYCVAKLRRQRTIDSERELELEVCCGEAAASIQSLVRRKQAGDRVTELRRQRDVETQRTVELELQQQRRSERDAATTIQRSVRRKQAGDRVTKMRRKLSLETRHRQELELERRREVEREAAECIERAARRRQADRRVKALRHQRDADVQRKMEESESERRVEAAACIQRAKRSRQAVARVDKLTRQRDADMEQSRADLERKLRGAVTCIQSSARRKQAILRVTEMRRQRDLEMGQKQKLELGRRREIEREAAECIERAARRRQAVRRVKALRVQRNLEESELERRTAAAACIQRATRSRQAVSRVDKLTRQRDADMEQSRADLERKLHVAATCIQSSARRKQAVVRVADMRRQRVLDLDQKQELELGRRREIEREAAECIERAARRRQAVQRAKALRQQRDADVQRTLKESELEMQAEAAVCIQRATRSRQAVARVDDLTRQQDADIERGRADLETKQHGAAVCIQRSARRKQAGDRVAEMRQQRDVETRQKQELELRRRREVEREAAECIERAARRRQAVQRVEDLRQQREGQRLARTRAVLCIQRAARGRQAVVRIASLRKQKYTDASRALEEAEIERQAVGRREQAATCIQRVVRRSQAVERVSALRKQGDIGIPRQLEDGLERRPTTRQEASGRIQRAVRVRQAVKHVAGLRLQRSLGLHRKEIELEQEQQKRTASDRERAVVILQRYQRQHTAVRRMQKLREERARRGEKKINGGGEEQKVESMSSMFAKMMESARRRTSTGDGEEPIPPPLPLPEQQAILVDDAPDTPADSQADSPRDSRESGDGPKGAFTDEATGSEVDGNETSEEALAPDDSSDSFESTTPTREEGEVHGSRTNELRHYDSSETERETGSSGATADGGGSEVSDRSNFGEEPADGRLPMVANAADHRDPANLQDQHHTVPIEIRDDRHGNFHEDDTTEDVLRLVVDPTSSPTIGQGVRNDGEVTVSSSDDSESLRQPVKAPGNTIPSSFPEVTDTAPEEKPLEADPGHDDGNSRDTEGFTAIVDSPAVQSNTMGDGPRPPVPHPGRICAEENHIPGDGVRPLDEGIEFDSDGESSTETEESLDGWETHVDEGTRRVFYYHPESGVTSWDHPLGAADSTDEESREEEKRELGAAGPDEVVPAPNSDGRQSINKDLHADRDRSQYDTTEKRDANGSQQTASSRDTSDTPVMSLKEQDGEEATASGASVINTEPKNDDLMLANTDTSEVPAVDGGSNAGEHQPKEWEEVLDPGTGSKYLYNPTTKQSTWALPESAKAAAAVAPAAVDTNAATTPMGG